MAAPKMLVGLGNPGPKYSETRHNIGWMVVDALAARQGATWQKRLPGQTRLNGEYAKTRLGDRELFVLKPGTYMNLSGHPTQAMAAFFGIHADEIVIVHDDLDLAFGRVQVKLGGGHGGHNGLRSLHEQIGNEYARIRVGIGRPAFAGADVADYVLTPFSAMERAELADVIDRAVKAIEIAVNDSIAAAMASCNGQKLLQKPGKSESPAANSSATSAERFATGERGTKGRD